MHIRQIIDDKGLVGKKKGKRVFNQEEMFKLRKSGLLPMNERIMNVRQHTGIHHMRDYRQLLGDWWNAEDYYDNPLYFRTRLYGVYKKGFEIRPDTELGKEVLFVDSETGAGFRFQVPDIRHPSDKNRSLHQATGMAVFDLDALDYDQEGRIVSAKSTFDPQTQLTIVDVMSGPDDLVILDVETLRRSAFDPPYEKKVTTAYGIGHSEWFVGEADGFHGSIEVFFQTIEDCGRRHFHPCLGQLVIGAGSDWSESFPVIAISKD